MFRLEYLLEHTPLMRWSRMNGAPGHPSAKGAYGWGTLRFWIGTRREELGSRPAIKMRLNPHILCYGASTELDTMEITCKICDQGRLTKTKKYRLSGPVVFIGYVLLVPSILGVLFSIMSFVEVSSMASGTGPTAASGIAGGITVFIGIAFFVSGLLGWLLVMKKQVLQCGTCGAAVNTA